jgi:hypothetical protein
MKKWHAAIVAMVFVFAIAIAGTVKAETIQSDIAVTRADIQADRQAIVADSMKLADAQATAFWPVYRNYRAELAKLGDRTVKLVTDYATNYDTLTDAQASSLTTEFLSIQKDTLKVKEKFVPKFNAVLSPKLVMRFFQIENKLDTILMIDAVDGIPLAK